MRAYLDIETAFDGSISVIGIYRPDYGTTQLVGSGVRDMPLYDALAGISTVVTFNGTSFDLPIIRRRLYADIKRDFEDVFASGVQAILAPATPSSAFGIGEKGRNDPTEMYLNDVFTVTVNLAGLPAISVPGALSGEGLPLGLQLIGRPFNEETLFSLGYVIEQAAGRFSPERWW